MAKKPDDRGGGPPPKNVNLTPDDPQWINITSGDLHWDLYCMLGDGFVVPAGGVATFDEVVIPDGKTLLSWSGQSLWTLEIPLLLNEWGEDLDPPDRVRKKDPPKFAYIKKRKKRRKEKEHWRRVRDRHEPERIQDYINLIADLAEPKKKGPPSHVRIYGKALPQRRNGDACHITDLIEGDYLYDKNGVRLLRQALTLTVTEANEGDEYKLRKRKGKGKGGGQEHKWYVVKKGDTLMKIAAQEYGDPNKWQRIAEANDIKNPRKLKVGDRLKIPR